MGAETQIISVVFAADLTRFSPTVNAASSDLLRFDAIARRSGGGLDTFSTGQKAAAVGALALAGGIAAAAHAAISLDESLHNVASIAPVSAAGFADMRDQVLMLSTELPVTAKDLADALYQISSSGFTGADALTVLKASATAATAGLSSVPDAATAILSVLNAYSLSAGQAGYVSDVLFRTVKDGVVTFPQLSQGIGEVVATAAAAHVPITDLGAALSAVTRVNPNFSVAITEIDRVILGLLHPTEALTAVLRANGQETGASALANLGLYRTLAIVQQATGGAADRVQGLFADLRATRGAIDLMAGGMRIYTAEAQAFADRNQVLGQTNSALHEQLKSTADQLQLLENRAAAAGITFATQLLPSISHLAGVFADAASGAEQLAGPLGRMLPTVVELGAAFALLRYGPGLLTALGASAVAPAQYLQGIAAGFTSVRAAAQAEAGAQAAATASLTAARLELTAMSAADVEAANAAKAVTVALLEQNAALEANAAAAVERAAAVQASSAAAAGGVEAGAGLAAGGVAGLLNPGFLAVAGVTAIGYAWFHARQETAKANAEAKAYAQTVAGVVDPGKTSSLGDYAAQTAAQVKLARDDAAALTSPAAVRGQSLDAIIKRAREAGADLKNADAIQKDYNDNLGKVTAAANTFGITTASAWNLIRGANVDLGKSTTNVVQQVGDALQKQNASTGLAGDALKNYLGTVQVVSDETSKALQAAQDATQKAFSGDLSLTGFSLVDRTTEQANIAAAKQQLDAARDQLAQAVQSQAETAARISVQGVSRTGRATGPSLAQKVSDPYTIARSAQAVTQAQQQVATAQANYAKVVTENQKSYGQQLAGYYNDQIKSATNFLRDLQQASQDGLNPQTLTDYLTAGPKAAGPVLEALVSDHSGRLERMANETATVMDRITTRAVETARLAQLAATSSTDKLARELPTAQAIELQLTTDPHASIESISQQLHKSGAVISAIAGDFGITSLTSRGPAVGTAIATGFAQHLFGGGENLAHGFISALAHSVGLSALFASHGQQPHVVVVPQSVKSETHVHVSGVDPQKAADDAHRRARRQALVGVQ